jgi:hypothetical protein
LSIKEPFWEHPSLFLRRPKDRFCYMSLHSFLERFCCQKLSQFSVARIFF